MGRPLTTYSHKLLCFVLVWLLLFSSIPMGHAFFEFTIKDEIELGKKFNTLIRSQLPLVHDPEITEYIEDLVKRLNKAMPAQPFPFVPGVIRHNAINAFATPGGYIFVFTGLILAMEHEAELASVMAHEMAHVSQRHIANRIQQSRAVSIVSILGALAGAFIGGDGGSALLAGSAAAGQAAMLSYSRADEQEADQVGFLYLTKAGFSPQGMPGAFKILGRKQWIMGGNIPTYYSTHPAINSRVDDMTARVAMLPAAERNKPYQDERFLRIQTLIRARYSDPDVANITFLKQLKQGENALTYMGQGILFSRQHKVQDAKNAFAKALGLAPKDPLILREAGRFHYSKGNKELGITYLRRAISHNPKDLMAIYYYAKVLEDEGRLADAIKEIQKVLKSVPEDVELHDILARLYGKSDKMFFAYLHMAYASLYSNNKKKTEQLFAKIKSMPSNPGESLQVRKFETIYTARKEFW